MTNQDDEILKFLDEKEDKERDDRFKWHEQEGLKNLLKHFDRIHDKLFTINNILIGGYLVLAKFEAEVPLWTILIPFVNLSFLIIIEWLMLSKSKFESQLRKKSQLEIHKWGKGISDINLYSLLMVLTTSGVTGYFLYLFFGAR